MSKNYYAEINLHLTWHTKLSIPVLTGRVETLTHQFIRQKLINTPGAFIHEMAAPTIVGREFRGSRKSQRPMRIPRLKPTRVSPVKRGYEDEGSSSNPPSTAGLDAARKAP